MGEEDAVADAPAAERALRFRNYKPRDAGLQKYVQPPVEIPNPLPMPSAAAFTDITADPLLNLAPKKANWDLKRDIEKDMAVLNGQTEAAIVDLLREKLAATEDGAQASSDLAAAVEQQVRAEGTVGDNDAS